jgi:hypothetical protein
MATYYVRPDGNNANTGTGSSTGQAWATVTYALANMALPDATNTLYIAPGTYRGTPTLSITPSVSNTLIVSGDPTASQFSGVAAGRIRITNFLSDDALPTAAATLTASSKTYFTFQNIHFEGYVTAASLAGIIAATDCRNFTFSKCVFSIGNRGGQSGLLQITSTTSTAINANIEKCIFVGGYSGLAFITNNTGTAYNLNASVTDCAFVNTSNYGIVSAYNLGGSGTGIGNGITTYNCTFNGASGVYINTTNTTHKSYFYNCNFVSGSGTGIIANANSAVEDYNRFTTAVTVTGISGGANSKVGVAGLDFSYAALTGLYTIDFYAPYPAGVAQGLGTASGAPATDLFGNVWSNTTPDITASTFKVASSVGVYAPAERNASTITIAPASTSQSIELYLGATGLVYNTSGLAAYYVRNQSAPVAITLVTQTPTGAWTSGGFAEIDSSAVPGVYRLDVPNAAFSAGASDVTIVVRGASGTNGAVLTVTLSSGGLTAAQTAAAVWGESPAGYATATTFGGVLNETNQLTNSIDQEVGDVAGNVWDELRTNHVTAGTFGQYVNAELVTPVTSAALVRMGPFEVRADGLGASDPLDIQTGAQHGIDLQCVDNNGAGIDITSATVTAKVYNSGATLVDTYACTATYAADGRATFTIDTTVTDTPGTYTATITRTTGASDTQVFGPLRIYVRDI